MSTHTHSFRMWACALSLSLLPVYTLENANRLFNESTGKKETMRAEAYCIIPSTIFVYSSFSLHFFLFFHSFFLWSSLKIPPSFAAYDTHHCAALSAPPIFLFLCCCCVFICGVWHIARPRDERRVGPCHHTFICLPFPFYMQNAVKD